MFDNIPPICITKYHLVTLLFITTFMLLVYEFDNLESTERTHHGTEPGYKIHILNDPIKTEATSKESFLDNYDSQFMPKRKNEIKTPQTIYDQVNHEAYIKPIINPPRFISQANKELIHNLSSKITLENNTAEKVTLKSKLFTVLSNVVQSQLSSLQKQRNCSGMNLLCGHEDGCGLGCQIHHRVACLIVSFALGIPLINDQNKWPFDDNWNTAFLPLGSRCEVGPETYRMEWRLYAYPVLYKNSVRGLNVLRYGSKSEKYFDQIEYPLQDGIPIPKEIATLVEIIHPKPFIWWVGQFMKFGLRLTHKMKKKIKKAKKEIKYTHPIVGLHIRRTDKVMQGRINSLYYRTKDYMNITKSYYDFNNSTDTKQQVKKVFIASEDATVLKTTIKEYPEWNIVGFESRKTLPHTKSRFGALFEIVTDFFLLLESDFVVCDFSSNICQLLYEMQSLVHNDGKNHFHSLHSNYSYDLRGTRLAQKIVKIRNKNPENI